MRIEILISEFKWLTSADCPSLSLGTAFRLTYTQKEISLLADFRCNPNLAYKSDFVLQTFRIFFFFYRRSCIIVPLYDPELEIIKQHFGTIMRSKVDLSVVLAGKILACDHSTELFFHF